MTRKIKVTRGNTVSYKTFTGNMMSSFFNIYSRGTYKVQIAAYKTINGKLKRSKWSAVRTRTL